MVPSAFFPNQSRFKNKIIIAHFLQKVNVIAKVSSEFSQKLSKTSCKIPQNMIQ